MKELRESLPIGNVFRNSHMGSSQISDFKMVPLNTRCCNTIYNKKVHNSENNPYLTSLIALVARGAPRVPGSLSFRQPLLGAEKSGLWLRVAGCGSDCSAQV